MDNSFVSKARQKFVCVCVCVFKLHFLYQKPSWANVAEIQQCLKRFLYNVLHPVKMPRASKITSFTNWPMTAPGAEFEIWESWYTGGFLPPTPGPQLHISLARGNQCGEFLRLPRDSLYVQASWRRSDLPQLFGRSVLNSGIWSNWHISDLCDTWFQGLRRISGMLLSVTVLE